jgi:hypothetical protein
LIRKRGNNRDERREVCFSVKMHDSSHARHRFRWMVTAATCLVLCPQ